MSAFRCCLCLFANINAYNEIRKIDFSVLLFTSVICAVDLSHKSISVTSTLFYKRFPFDECNALLRSANQRT